ncbi:hypothetical protein SESBI_10294 [Sesbania bispinosa]|nr:hypothetical protein SESBI_10294 [Sesbania bispinosa]
MASVATPDDPYAIQMLFVDEEVVFYFMGIVTTVSEEIRLNKEERVTRLVLLDLVDDM